MEDFQFKLFTPFDNMTSVQIRNVADFLYDHLQEYGDAKEYIEKAVNYAMEKPPAPGGYVLTCSYDHKIVGTVVVNKTGMGGYIPENILVYIAVHQDMRGRGLGKKLMKHALRMSDGDVALHVEPDNPAAHLYRKLGFTSKYLEMRWSVGGRNGNEKEAERAKRESANA
jgi:ribosomal-protein-alanine N-acetyltransferase